MDKGLMNLGVHLGQTLKQNQAETFLTCESRSLEEGERPCLQRGGHMELSVFFLVAAQVSLPSFSRG